MTAPCLDVEYGDGWVRGYEWPINVSPIAVTVDNPGTAGVDFTGSSHSDREGLVELDLLEFFPIQPGFTVTMSYGATTRTTIVTHLTIEEVHEDDDLVEGNAVAGTEVHALAMNNTEFYEFPGTMTADVDGHWSADFTGQVDFVLGTEAIAYQVDAEGDMTSAKWSSTMPNFGVNLNLDYLWAMGWTPGEEMEVYVDSVLIDTHTVSDTGNVWHRINLLPGQVVKLKTPSMEKIHTVGNISLTEVNQDLDYVKGTADPGAEINFSYGLDVVADGSGVWTGNLTLSGIDLKPGYEGYAQLPPDEDNDYSEVYWASNDDIRFPTPLETFPAYSHLDTTDAGHEADDDSRPDPSYAGCGQTVGLATVWYTFKFAEPGEISIDTMGSNYDTMLGVWTGEPGSMTRVVCNDNALGKVQSQLNFKYAANVKYHVGVAQKGSAETGGDLRLNFTTFFDVPGNHPLWRFVEGFFDKGITTGCAVNPLKYCPTQVVTRAQMAVFMLRAVHVDDATPYVPADVNPDTFADSPINAWMEPWIEQFYELGYTTGCGGSTEGVDLKYCPEKGAGRAELATFIDRIFGFPQLPDLP